MTETDYCPESGAHPTTYGRSVHERSPNPKYLMTVRVMGGPLSDAQAEHERAMLGAYEWTRDADGKVRFWGDR